MEYKGTFDTQKVNPTTMEFILFILSRGLLPYNQLGICRSKNKKTLTYYCSFEC